MAVIRISEFVGKPFSDEVWAKLKIVHNLEETYRSGNVAVARDKNKHRFTFDILNGVIETEMMDAAGLQALFKNYDMEGKPLFVGREVGLEEVKALAPSQYVIVLPLGGDRYLIVAVVDWGKAFEVIEKRAYTGTRYTRVVVHDGEVFDTTEYWGNAGGPGLVAGNTRVSHPFDGAAGNLDSLIRSVRSNDVNLANDYADSFIVAMFVSIYDYDETEIRTMYVDEASGRLMGKRGSRPDELMIYEDMRVKVCSGCATMEELQAWLPILVDWFAGCLEGMKDVPLPSYFVDGAEVEEISDYWRSVVLPQNSREVENDGLVEDVRS